MSFPVSAIVLVDLEYWPSLFVGSLAPAYMGGLISAFSVVAVALLGVLLTFVTSWLLSRTLLRGEVSTFSLELPPYRPPRILQTLYTSIIDRTIFVLLQMCTSPRDANFPLCMLEVAHQPRKFPPGPSSSLSRSTRW